MTPGHSFNVTASTFDGLVIQRSMAVPVVLELWATWCEPCKQLSPILEALADEHDGRWVLAKVDVEAETQIAQAFQVQAVPSVFAIVQGQPIPLFQGAHPEAQVRQVIDQLLQVAATAGGGVGAPSANTQLEDVPPSLTPGGSLGYGSTGKKSSPIRADSTAATSTRLGYGTGKSSK